jgi:hypothetical protein
MFSTVIQRFARPLSPLALAITFVGRISGMALVAGFAPDLVEYFAASSVSIAPWRTEFDRPPSISKAFPFLPTAWP